MSAWYVKIIVTGKVQSRTPAYNEGGNGTTEMLNVCNGEGGNSMVKKTMVTVGLLFAISFGSIGASELEEGLSASATRDSTVKHVVEGRNVLN